MKTKIVLYCSSHSSYKHWNLVKSYRFKEIRDVDISLFGK